MNNIETATQDELIKVLREKVKNVYEFLEEVEAKTNFHVTAISQMTILDKSDIEDVNMQNVFRILGRDAEIAIALSEVDCEGLDDVLNMRDLLKRVGEKND